MIRRNYPYFIGEETLVPVMLADSPRPPNYKRKVRTDLEL